MGLASDSLGEEAAQGGVVTGEVVGTPDEVDHRYPNCGLEAEAASVQQLALEGGEERLRHGFAIGVANRTDLAP